MDTIKQNKILNIREFPNKDCFLKPVREVCVYMLMCLLEEVSLCGLKSRKSHEFAFFLVILLILKFFLMINNIHFCSSPRFQPETKGNGKSWYYIQEPIKMTCCIICVLGFLKICDSLFKTQVAYLAHL